MILLELTGLPPAECIDHILQEELDFIYDDYEHLILGSVSAGGCIGLSLP
jgi:hypothetical protein